MIDTVEQLVECGLDRCEAVILITNYLGGI